MKTETQTVRRYGFVDTPKSLPEWKEHKHGTYVTFRDYERDIASRDAKLAALEAALEAQTFTHLGTVAELQNHLAALEAKVQKLREACKWAHILLGSCPQSNMDYDICMEKLRAALNSNAGEKGAG